MMSIKDITSKVVNGAKKHSPEILIGMGVTGMIASTVLAVRATPKALELIEDKKDELDVDWLTKKEIVEAAWRPYVPSIALSVVSAACIIGGTTTNLKRNAALATVYSISENTLKEYQRRTVEIVGEEKAKEIEREVSRGKARENISIVSTDDSQFLCNTGDGNTLFYDTLSGRYFRSSVNSVDRAINNINKMMLTEHYITINEFYNELGIPTIGAGSLIGWIIDREMADISYDSDLDENGNPYVVIEYKNKPRPLYDYNGRVY